MNVKDAVDVQAVDANSSRLLGQLQQTRTGAADEAEIVRRRGFPPSQWTPVCLPAARQHRQGCDDDRAVEEAPPPVIRWLIKLAEQCNSNSWQLSVR
jgi:hypothetical protein